MLNLVGLHVVCKWGFNLGNDIVLTRKGQFLLNYPLFFKAIVSQ